MAIFAILADYRLHYFFTILYATNSRCGHFEILPVNPSRGLVRKKDISNSSDIKISDFYTNKSLIGRLVFISLIRMRSKRDIKMGRLCTPGGAVLGIVGGGV